MSAAAGEPAREPARLTNLVVRGSHFSGRQTTIVSTIAGACASSFAGTVFSTDFCGMMRALSASDSFSEGEPAAYSDLARRLLVPPSLKEEEARAEAALQSVVAIFASTNPDTIDSSLMRRFDDANYEFTLAKRAVDTIVAKGARELRTPFRSERCTAVVTNTVARLGWVLDGTLLSAEQRSEARILLQFLKGAEEAEEGEGEGEEDDEDDEDEGKAPGARDQGSGGAEAGGGEGAGERAGDEEEAGLDEKLLTLSKQARLSHAIPRRLDI